MKGSQTCVLLLLEDHDEAIRIEDYLVQGFGPTCEVHHAESLQTAVRILSAVRIDVILLDLSVSIVEGRDLFHRVYEAGSGTPIVVLTGGTEESDTETIHVRAYDYLSKDALSPRALVKSLKYTIDRNEMEERLRESQEQYRLIAASAVEAIFTMNQAGKIVYANPAAERISGYSIQEMENRPITMFLPEPMQKMYDDIIRKYLEEGIRSVDWKGFPMTAHHRSGSEIHLEVSCSEYFRRGNRYFTIIARDVSERKSLECLAQAQAGRREVISTLTRSAFEGIDPSTLIQSATREVARVLNAGCVFAAQFLPEYKLLQVRAAAGSESDRFGSKEISCGDNSGFAYLLRSYGSLIIVNLKEEERFLADPVLVRLGVVSSCTVLINHTPSPYGVFSVCEIRSRSFTTEEVQFLEDVAGVLSQSLHIWKSKENLRKSEEKYRSLFEESKDTVFISTPDGRVIDINPAGVELFGYESKQELLKAHIQKDFYVSEQQREEYEQVLKQQGYVKDFELKLKKRGGEILHVMETSTAVVDREGNTVAYRGIIRDVTGMRQLQQQLIQSQKMETVGRLAGGLAHDFNNILMAIMGYCDLLRLRVPERADVLMDVSEVYEAAAKGARLTRQLLALSRNRFLAPQIIDPRTLLMEMIGLIRRLAGEAISVSLTTSSDLGLIKIDPGQLEQVMINLVVNARDSMPEGGSLVIDAINVDLGQGYSDIHVAVPPGEYVCVSVTDTGIGMGEDVLPFIFEPFFTTKDPEKGTGLGLATVYRIVKQSDGHIHVYSEKGYGTKFKVYFPRQDRPDQKDAEITDNEVVSSAGIKILLVDDNPSICRAVVELLKMQGHSVTCASSGKEALEIAARCKGRLDLLITDVVMPNLSGRELAQQIRIQMPEVKVLFMSGFSQDVIRESAGDGTGFIQKPFSLKGLSEAIQRLLPARNAKSGSKH